MIKKKEDLHWYLSLQKFLKLKNSLLDINIQYQVPFDIHYSEFVKDWDIPLFSYEQKEMAVINALAYIMKDKSKEFALYVCKGKPVDEMSFGEAKDSIERYDYFCSLDYLFRHLCHWKQLDELGHLSIESQFYTLPAVHLFVVRKLKNRRGKSEMIVQRQSFKNDIFDNLNLNRLKQCARCNDYFYAAKDDERIKFCSTKCGNTTHLENFHKKGKQLNGSL